MSDLITRLYDSYDDAQSALAALVRDGFTEARISLIGQPDGIAPEAMGDSALADAEIGAGLGGAMGAGFGLLTGLGFLPIPGVGPVLAVGWLFATAVGAAIGALAGGATGGIIGALAASGRTETEDLFYRDSAQRGGTLVTVRVPDGRLAEVRRILNPHRPIDRAAPGGESRVGWGGFDANASPYVTTIAAASLARAPPNGSGAGSVPPCGMTDGG